MWYNILSTPGYYWYKDSSESQWQTGDKETEMATKTLRRAKGSGSVRQRTRGGIRPRNLAATEQDQDNEIKSTATQYLATTKTIQGDDGLTYHVLYFESEVFILWDETRAFILHNREPTSGTTVHPRQKRFWLGLF